MLQSFRNRSDYPFWFEVAPLLLTTAILMVQFFIFKDYTPHVPLIIGICITGLFMSLKGRKWIDMEHNMYRVMKVALPTMIIIMCVGMVIASWIAAGTVPTILDFGLGMLSPRIFLPATCILATVVSLATGTSWGTVGTVGLAIMGIAQALGVPEYWDAWAISSRLPQAGSRPLRRASEPQPRRLSPPALMMPSQPLHTWQRKTSDALTWLSQVPRWGRQHHCWNSSPPLRN